MNTTVLAKKSKFHNITFPAIGLYEVPEVKVTTNQIMVRKQGMSQESVIDDFGPEDFVQRFIDSDPTVFFDATILNLQQLITSRVVWLIDTDSKVHDLRKKELFKAKSLKVVKVGNGVCWAAGISYPFEVKKHLISPKLLLSQYVTVVNIDRQWVLYEFTAFKKEIHDLRL